MKMRGGGTKIKLLNHIFALYSLPITQKFSLATLARLHFILQLKLQCDFTTPVIFSCIFGVIIPDSQLPKCTKTRLKWHKIAYKASKHRFRSLRPGLMGGIGG